jgi:formylglycine-generating enzyme required for sulfatase activity
MAAAYCNWQSKKEGLPKEDWCYLPNGRERYDKGMKIPANVGRRQGYRLPTEAEWECACRAGTQTSRYYGNTLILLDRYAWYLKNSGDPFRVQPCGRALPNDLGLFDMLGNAYEWCQDRQGGEPGGAELSIDEIIDEGHRPLRGGAFNFNPAGVRSAYRYWNAPTVRLRYYGLRLARTYN